MTDEQRAKFEELKDRISQGLDIANQASLELQKLDIEANFKVVDMELCGYISVARILVAEYRKILDKPIW